MLGRTAVASLACVLAAVAWAGILHRGWSMASLLLAYHRFPGAADGTPFATLAAVVLVPLAVVPASIVIAAAGLLWRQRWALALSAVTAVVAVAHVGTVLVISWRMIGTL
ncbi:MAG: hypothetical protein R3F59_23430 [Myxococcota bacterium]